MSLSVRLIIEFKPVFVHESVCQATNGKIMFICCLSVYCYAVAVYKVNIVCSSVSLSVCQATAKIKSSRSDF